MTINSRQRRFIEEYLVDLNATRAATRAGYSVKTARQIGSRLLTLVDIQKEIRLHFVEAHEKQRKALMIAADVAINALIDIAKNGSGSARVSAANSILERANHKISDMRSIEDFMKDSMQDQKSPTKSFLDRLYELKCDSDTANLN